VASPRADPLARHFRQIVDNAEGLFPTVDHLQGWTISVAGMKIGSG